ncbi:ornithine carbamoyltransferase, partial [Lactiplantibacillus plantarum]
PAVVALAQQYAQAAGSTVVITADPQQAVTQADALYTDVWVSMGEQVDYGERIKQLLPFQINTALLAATGKSSTIVMHCLPALHDLKTQLGAKLGEQYGMTAFEITDDVFQSKQAVVFEEAGNRMPAIKAVMAATLGNLFIPTSIFN